jgi:hypothetical protein
MKTTLKVLTAILTLGLVILIGLHLFLQYGLTRTMREVVLPRLEAETGIAATVGRLSINLPNGILYLKDVAVKNPAGFLLENMASIDRINVEVDILSLLKQKLIRVKNIEIENALVNVIRNKDGEININRVQEGMPQPPHPAVEGRPVPDGGKPSLEKPDVEAPSPPPAALPEVLIEALQCNAKVRYLDFKLDQLDIVLDLNVIGSNLSTQKDPSTPWGDVSVIGSLGSKRTRFVTDLQLRLAPVVDPQVPSFDLTGKVMEIDPRILEKAYGDLGIHSAPFGLDPKIHCREGWFKESTVTLNLVDIVFEDKLAKRLGGMASVGSLRFSLPVEGSLRKPVVDLQQALYGALGGNAQTLLGSFLKGVVAKETGRDEPPENLADAAVELLGEHVDEIGESETVQKILKDLADGGSSDTNAPSPISSDVLIDILGEQVEEIGENEALKGELKNLGKWLFGQ